VEIAERQWILREMWQFGGEFRRLSPTGTFSCLSRRQNTSIWGFRGAWEEGQKLQGLWNDEAVAEFRKYQDPEQCYKQWLQDQVDEAARDAEYMEAYKYFKGGY
jgi:hypothetical protein